jgi:TPR repeat protein
MITACVSALVVGLLTCPPADADAAVELANAAAFEWGIGVPQDYHAALTWYARAASHGSTAALVDIGILIEDGMGVTADPTRAIVLFKAAAEAGSASGEIRLGMALEWGRGIGRDPVEASLHYHRAALAGEPMALIYLSLMNESQ